MLPTTGALCNQALYRHAFAMFIVRLAWPSGTLVEGLIRLTMSESDDRVNKRDYGTNASSSSLEVLMRECLMYASVLCVLRVGQLK